MSIPPPGEKSEDILVLAASIQGGTSNNINPRPANPPSSTSTSDLEPYFTDEEPPVAPLQVPAHSLDVAAPSQLPSLNIQPLVKVEVKPDKPSSDPPPPPTLRRSARLAEKEEKRIKDEEEKRSRGEDVKPRRSQRLMKK